MILGVRNTDDLLAVAIYARERVNPYLFQYAFSVTLLHRPDTEGLELPSVVHSFPEKFFENNVIGKAREQATVVAKESRVRIYL